MPKYRFCSGCALFCALTLVSCVSLVAEDSVSRSTADIEDPKSLLPAASKVNGLAGDDMKPWHLKASFDFLANSGQSTDRGTIEIRWAGPKMSKLIIRDASSTLTYIQTDEGMYREGELNERLALVMSLAGSFVRPLPYAQKSLQYLDISSHLRPVGSSELRCLTINQKYNRRHEFDPPTVCLENDLPILRICSYFEDPHEFFLNKISKFQGHYVPLEVTVGEGSSSELTAHVELLQNLESIDPAAFKPGAEAELLIRSQGVMVIPDGTLESVFLRHDLWFASHPRPEYPPEAKAANVHGTVKLRAWIGTDGHITSLYVIDGPPMLRQGALDAVWRWRFDPPMHNAVPVEVLAVIPVSF
jgi:TonB family protein